MWKNRKTTIDIAVNETQFDTSDQLDVWQDPEGFKDGACVITVFLTRNDVYCLYLQQSKFVDVRCCCTIGYDGEVLWALKFIPCGKFRLRLFCR